MEYIRGRSRTRGSYYTLGGFSMRRSTIPTGLAMLFLLAGCNNLFNQHAQMMDAMRGVMADTAARLSESGTGQIAAGGQVINPGLRVSGGFEYYVVAQYEGVSGQVLASLQGNLDREVSQGVQARIDAIWRDSSLSEERKLGLIRELFETQSRAEP